MQKPAHFVLSLLLFFLLSGGVLACPFCSDDSRRTQLHSEIEEKVIAALVRPVGDVPNYSEMLGARKFGFKELSFEVVSLLRGPEAYSPGTQFKAKALGFMRKEALYLMTSTREDLARPKFRELSAEAGAFLNAYVSLLADEADSTNNRNERLKFFIQHLDSADNDVAAAARWEFSRAPYRHVRLLPGLAAEEIIRRIDAPAANTPAYGLHFLFLGLWGNAEHLPLFEKWLASPDRFSREDVDGLMSAYLMLAGADGLPRLIEVIGQAQDEETKQMSFSLMKALRFHTSGESVLKKEDFIRAYRATITNPHVAYWAIGELRRLEDWDSLPTVWKAYADLKEMDTDKQQLSNLRYSVKSYLQKCPEPIADEYLTSLMAEIAATKKEKAAPTG